MKNQVYQFIQKSIALAAISSCSLSVLASPSVPENMLKGWDTISQSSLHEDINFLTSNKLQGRLALQKGDDLAIQWIADEFKAAGLKPANNGSYLQAVDLIEYTPDRQQSYVMLERSGIKKQWKKPDVFTEFFKDTHLNAGVVFAGYGITAPELNYDDYKDIDVRDKIVLIFEHEPQETNKKSIFNGTGNTPYATNRIKALNAQLHGAIAVLIAPEPNRKHPSNQERYAHIGGASGLKKPIASMVRENDELHIPVAILSDQAAKEIVGSGLSLSKAQSAIDADLKPQSKPIADTIITIHDQNTSQRKGTTYNVAGLLEGSDPELKEETIIISGHHDHDGVADKKMFPGADDNASGTVGVVSMARAIAANNASKNGMKPKRSILFVVFAAEERGLLGAFYMAANPLRPLATTRAMINFDMIGRNEAPTPQTNGLIAIPKDTKNRLNLIGAHYSPDYSQTVKQQNNLVKLTLDDRYDNECALNTFFRSDQFPFILHGVPAFWWFTGFHPDYHHETDTADKINYVKMQKILRLAYLSTYAFADDEQYPEFIPAPKQI